MAVHLSHLLFSLAVATDCLFICAEPRPHGDMVGAPGQGCVNREAYAVREPSRPDLTGLRRGCNEVVLDLVYILITLVSFAGLAALVGLIDRRLGQPSDTDSGAAPTETEPRAVSR